MNISSLLKNKRQERGLSLDRLSEISGVPKTTIYHYEEGTRPTVEKLDKLLKALGTSITIGKEAPND